MGHHLMIAVMASMLVLDARRHLATISEPAAHKGDFIGLRRADLRRDLNNVLIVGALFHHVGHHDRLLVVRDHVLHEPDIVSRVCCCGYALGLIDGEVARIFAWGTRLHDWDILCRGDRDAHRRSAAEAYKPN